MSYNDFPKYLQDILTCIKNISSFRLGMSIEQIRADRKTEAAIERELQIITEAGFRLGEQAEVLCPGADWRAIRGFGNMLRHAYDRLDPEMLHNILDEDLPSLEKQVSAGLMRVKTDFKPQLP